MHKYAPPRLASLCAHICRQEKGDAPSYCVSGRDSLGHRDTVNRLCVSGVCRNAVSVWLPVNFDESQKNRKRVGVKVALIPTELRAPGKTWAEKIVGAQEDDFNT